MRRLMLSLYPPASERNRAQDGHIGWFLTTFGLVLLVSLVAAALFALSSIPTGFARLDAPNFGTFIGLALLVGAAGFAVGGFAGFLFGVPRMQTGNEGTEPNKRPAAQVVSNTNLETLSDWLTKILVGVGLVQIHEANRLLAAFRDQIDAALTTPGVHHLPGAGFAACLILIGSTVAGFLAAYLKSKTDLMRAFREPIEMVQSALGAVAQTVIVDAARHILNRPSSVPDACSRDTAARLVQFVPPDSDDPDLYQLAGLAHAVLKNFKAAAEALRTAVDLRRERGAQVDPALNAFATRALALAGEVDVARAIGAGDLPAEGPLDKAGVEHALAMMFAGLYARGGQDDAIAIGRRLARDGEARRSGRLWLYLACAWGQRHAMLVQRDRDHAVDVDAAIPPRPDDDIAEARDAALCAARQALALDRGKNEAVLRRLWNPAAPGKATTENDLESLHDDPAFASLLGGT